MTSLLSIEYRIIESIFVDMLALVSNFVVCVSNTEKILLFIFDYTMNICAFNINEAKKLFKESFFL